VELALITDHDEWVELRHLASFAAVVRHGGFTRAADALHLAQPAVSEHVRRLEAELGSPLLTRTTRRVTLTRAGELVLRRAERVLDELDGARADVAGLASALAGRVRIGAIQALEPLDLPRALAAFSRRHPGVDLSLTSGRSRELVADLEAGRVDLALAPVPGDLPPRVTSTTLFDEELVLITPTTHLLAGRAALGLADLAGEPFVCLPADSGLRARLDRACADAGFRPSVPFEASGVERIRELVAHGLGVALLARSVTGSGSPVAVHVVHPEPLRRAVALMHRTGALDPATAACAEVLRDAVQPPVATTS
jgi:DNA-binding transcriptional LysR family regulator